MRKSAVKQRALASARAVIPKFDIIAELCDLEPVDSWRKWIDEEDNFLRIKKDSKVEIYPSGDDVEVTTKDVYRKAPPEVIVRHSYWCLAALSEKSDGILWLIGTEGRLRACTFRDGSWGGNQPPLLSGMGVLKLVATRYLEDEPKPLKRLPGPIKFGSFEAQDIWSFGLPISGKINNTELEEKLNCLVKIR